MHCVSLQHIQLCHFHSAHWDFEHLCQHVLCSSFFVNWMMIDADKCWLVLIDVDWFWLIPNDVDWCWLIMIDSELWLDGWMDLFNSTPLNCCIVHNCSVQRFLGQTRRCTFLEENKPPANQVDHQLTTDVTTAKLHHAQLYFTCQKHFCNYIFKDCPNKYAMGHWGQATLRTWI